MKRSVLAYALACCLAWSHVKASEAQQVIDMVFILDHTGSIAGPERALQIDSLRRCLLEGRAPIPTDGSIAIAAVSLHGDQLLPLTVLDSAGDVEDALVLIESAFLLANTDCQGSSCLAVGLDAAQDIFTSPAAVGSLRYLFISSDFSVIDGFAAQVSAQSLRTLPVPVQICSAKIALGPSCDEFAQDLAAIVANTPNSPFFEPSEPVGARICLAVASQFEELCITCGCPDVFAGYPDSGVNGIPDVCEPDCNGNQVPDDVDILDRTSFDCNSDGIPDECQPYSVVTEFRPASYSGNDIGRQVAMDGQTAIVGAPTDATTVGFGTGAVYVYTQDPTTLVWSQQGGELMPTAGPNGSASGDAFGTSVAIDGDRMAVGAPGWDSASAGNQGAVFVFNRDPVSGVWTMDGDAITGTGAGPWGIGSSVALRGDYLMAGASNDSTIQNSAGSAYVFRRDPVSGVWTQLARLDPVAASGSSTSAARFGTAVATDGISFFVGAPFQSLQISPGWFDQAGQVYVYGLFGGAVFPTSPLPACWSRPAACTRPTRTTRIQASGGTGTTPTAS